MTIDRTEFRTLAPDEQIRALRGQKVERFFEIEQRGVDAKKRTAWLSIASEQPYERWWGIEVLDVGKRSIRDQRMRSGAPLLVGHDAADQVGVVEDFEITADRKLRILARFGKSARAEEVWQDVLDGIRRNTSVGYVIHDMVLEKQSEGQNTYRVTDWEPYEGSLVAVPADPTVGLGRNHNQSRKNFMAHENESNNDRKTRSELRGEDSEARRVKQLHAAGQTFRDIGGPELADDLINNGGTVEQFNFRMLESMRGKQKPTATAEPFVFPGEARIAAPSHRGNLHPILLRQFDGDSHRAAEALFGAGQWLRARLTGNKTAARWCMDKGLMQRDASEGIDTDGGFLAPSVLSGAVIDFTQEYGVARQECRIIPMSSMSMNVPTRETGVTSYFVGEGSEVTKSAATWGSVGLNPKKLAVLSVMSSEVDEDAVIDLAAWLAMECGRSFAEKEDDCWINGDGTSTYGGMSGIRTKIIDGNHNAAKIAATSGDDTFAEIIAGDLDRVIAAVPTQALKNAKWLMSRACYATAILPMIRAAGGVTLTDLVNGPLKQGYLGYPIVLSEKMPNAPATNYNGQVMLAFGDFAQSTIIGTRRDIRVKVDSSRYLEFDQIAIMATERFHIVNHQMGNNSTAGAVVGLVGTT